MQYLGRTSNSVCWCVHILLAPVAGAGLVRFVLAVAQVGTPSTYNRVDERRHREERLGEIGFGLSPLLYSCCYPLKVFLYSVNNIRVSLLVVLMAETAWRGSYLGCTRGLGATATELSCKLCFNWNTCSCTLELNGNDEVKHTACGYIVVTLVVIVVKNYVVVIVVILCRIISHWIPQKSIRKVQEMHRRKLPPTCSVNPMQMF